MEDGGTTTGLPFVVLRGVGLDDGGATGRDVVGDGATLDAAIGDVCGVSPIVTVDDG